MGAPEPAFTVCGYYGENEQIFTTVVYTTSGPEKALNLAHEACAIEQGVADADLRIVAIFHGEPELVNFDHPEPTREPV